MPPAPRARTLLRTDVLLLLALLVFALAALAAQHLFGLGEPVHLGSLASLALAAVPALIWLAYFYLQDRREPEPKHFVLGVYLLGAFVAAPLAGFLAAPPEPAAQPSARHVLAAIFSIGLAQELAKYLTVRYSVYLSDEFDEPMDGIVYMTAAGIGFATAENVRYLEGLDGTVFLATGVMNVVVTTLAHGCFAGILGYALGRARFIPRPLPRQLMLIAGLLVAAVLNGLFFLAERNVRAAGLRVEPWRGLAFAAAFAAAVFAATYVLIRRRREAAPS